jgi:hypothetical protein
MRDEVEEEKQSKYVNQKKRIIREDQLISANIEIVTKTYKNNEDL